MATYTNSLWSEVSDDKVFARDGSATFTRTFRGPWSEQFLFIAAAKGGVYERGGRLFRQLPARYPTCPWLWVSEAKVKPVDSEYPGTSSGSDDPLRTCATHSTCFVTLTYSSPDNDKDSDADSGGEQSEAPPGDEKQELDIATHTWDFSARNLTLPNKYYQWETTGGGVASGNDLLANQNVAATMTTPQVGVVIVRHMCFRKPHQAILANLGRVNKSAFTLAGDAYAIETLRFDSAKVSRKTTTNGVKYYEITYSFMCQPVYDTLASSGDAGYVGWNRLFNPNTGKWHRVYLKTNTSRYIYQYDEDGPTQTNVPGKSGFALLFHPGAK